MVGEGEGVSPMISWSVGVFGGKSEVRSVLAKLIGEIGQIGTKSWKSVFVFLSRKVEMILS